MILHALTVYGLGLFLAISLGALVALIVVIIIAIRHPPTKQGEGLGVALFCILMIIIHVCFLGAAVQVARGAGW